MNDPFGGWVYWTRMSPDELERVELSRGAATSVFGDRAMSGAISLFSRSPEPLHLIAGYEYGNKDSHALTTGLAHRWQRFGVSGTVRSFTTDGYYVVREDRRGAVDTRAGVRFVSGVTRLDYLGASDRFFVKLDILAEERANGTSLTENSTSLGTIAGHYTKSFTNDTISVLGYHTRQQYHASFSAVSAGRNTERITFLQTVPAEAVGAPACGVIMGAVGICSPEPMCNVSRVQVRKADYDEILREGGGSQVQQARLHSSMRAQSRKDISRRPPSVHGY